MTVTQANYRLQQFIDKIERLEEEKKELAEEVTNIYLEAKTEGFDTQVMRKVVKLRKDISKMSNAERQEKNILLETYLKALNMQIQLSEAETA